MPRSQRSGGPTGEVKGLPRIIDGASVSKIGLALCAFSLMLDGLDNQTLGLVMPSLMADWGLPRSTFAPFIVITVILMSVGTVAGGWAGDRFGRKPVLFSSLMILGALTLASSMAANVPQLLLLRGLAALGMGGVMPNATALLAEYVSHRHRSLSVAFGVSAIPLGGVLGGLLGSMALPAFGWRAMFLVAGGVTVLVALATAAIMPESPKRSTDRAQEAFTGVVAESDDDPIRYVGQTIFSHPFRRDTLALWCALFFSMLGVYSMINWVPTLLSEQGYSLATASLGLAMFNVGGILASWIIAAAMDRYGSRRPLLLTGLAGGLVAAIANLAIAPGNAPALAILPLAAMGFFIAGMQAALIAFSARVYPTAMRATGMGAMMAVGRLGALASSVTGTLVLGLGSGYFLLAMGAAIVVAGLASLFARSRVSHIGDAREPVGPTS